MVCPESCLGWCDIAGGSAHATAVMQNVCVWGFTTALTGKETEAQRSEALSFSRLPSLLICLIPTYSTMGTLFNSWGSLRLYTIRITVAS